MAKSDPIPVDDQGLSLRQIIDCVPAQIHSGRQGSHLYFFNQTWFRYVERPREDLQDWKWIALIHSDVSAAYD
jgi:hypothetical protein